MPGIESGNARFGKLGWELQVWLVTCVGCGEALRDVILVEIISKSSGPLVAWLSQT